MSITEDEFEEYFEDLDERTADVCRDYIEHIFDEIGWYPTSLDHSSGIWYCHDEMYATDEVLFSPSDGTYSIYYTESIDGTEKEERFGELMACWSAELSVTGEPAKR